MVGRQQNCNSDIAASVGTTTRGVTSGFGQARRGGVHGEKYVKIYRVMRKQLCRAIIYIY